MACALRSRSIAAGVCTCRQWPYGVVRHSLLMREGGGRAPYIAAAGHWLGNEGGARVLERSAGLQLMPGHVGIVGLRIEAAEASTPSTRSQHRWTASAVGTNVVSRQC